MNLKVTVSLILLTLGVCSCQNERKEIYNKPDNSTKNPKKEIVMEQEAMPKTGEVLYMDFGIDPIVGYHKEDIEKYGIKCNILKNDFMKSLKNSPQFEFSKLALKAKIDFPEDTYWVDGNLIVYSENTGNIWNLDKETFIKSLQNCK